jgi:hypothetical protein
MDPNDEWRVRFEVVTAEVPKMKAVGLSETSMSF